MAVLDSPHGAPPVVTSNESCPPCTSPSLHIDTTETTRASPQESYSGEQNTNLCDNVVEKSVSDTVCKSNGDSQLEGTVVQNVTSSISANPKEDDIHAFDNELFNDETPGTFSDFNNEISVNDYMEDIMGNNSDAPNDLETMSPQETPHSLDDDSVLDINATFVGDLDHSTSATGHSENPSMKSEIKSEDSDINSDRNESGTSNHNCLGSTPTSGLQLDEAVPIVDPIKDHIQDIKKETAKVSDPMLPLSDCELPISKHVVSASEDDRVRSLLTNALKNEPNPPSQDFNNSPPQDQYSLGSMYENAPHFEYEHNSPLQDDDDEESLFVKVDPPLQRLPSIGTNENNRSIAGFYHQLDPPPVQQRKSYLPSATAMAGWHSNNSLQNRSNVHTQNGIRMPKDSYNNSYGGFQSDAYGHGSGVGDESKGGDYDEEYKPPSSVNKKRKAAPKAEQAQPRKRARTAREWHELQRLRCPPQSAIVWKNEEFNRIKHGQGATKKLPINGSIRAFDPSVFLAKNSGDNHSQGNGQPRRVNKPVAEGVQATTYTNKDAAFEGLWGDDIDPKDKRKYKADANRLMRDSRMFGYNRVKRTPPKWELKGMPTPLYNSQLIGVSHIVSRECGIEAPLGALLADQMGLGKTIQAIAACIANPPTDDSIRRGVKTTLIVVPSSLKSQWLEEIGHHAGQIKDYMITFEKSRRDITPAYLRLADIVLTTYWELAQSLPNPDQETRTAWKLEAKRRTKLKLPDFDWYEAYEDWMINHWEERGTLHRVHWYRVILDEGHNIKNHLSRTSRAAVKLSFDHPLVMSGTPIMNSYLEFYPLLRFLREPITSELHPDAFLKKFGNYENPVSRASLGVLLSDIIIHRRIDDQLFGKPIVSLPLYDKKIRTISADPAEDILLSYIQKRFEELLLPDSEVPKGDPREKLKSRLAQFTRLRQLTANADLIGQQIMVLFEVEEMQKMQALIKPHKDPRNPRAIPNVLYHRLSIWIDARKNGEHLELSDDLVSCDICEMPTEEVGTLVCGHKACEDCFDQILAGYVGEAEDGEPLVQCLKVDCGKISKTSGLRVSFSDQHKQRKAAQKRRKGKGHGHGNGWMRGHDDQYFRPSFGPDQRYSQKWLERFDSNQIDILPSTKLNGTVEQIKYWVENKPQDKIIVFSQFRHFQILLGIMLSREKIPFLYYTGDMSQVNRKKAVDIFKDNNQNIKVLVAGLKCGGVGLNLTCANRVLITDPWWNSSVDDQAFGRVRRIGQNKLTYQRKICIAESVDEALIDIQMRKEKAIGYILQDELNERDWDQLLGANKFASWEDVDKHIQREKTIIDEGMEDEITGFVEDQEEDEVMKYHDDGDASDTEL